MATKPDIIKAAKDAGVAGDRHTPTAVAVSPGVWARELSTLRISDLFRTLPGLPGHWAQVQAQVNAGNHYFFQTTITGPGFNDGGKTSDEGKGIIAFLADAIVGAADAAAFDFPVMQMKFTSDSAFLKIARVNGRLDIKSSPGNRKA